MKNQKLKNIAPRKGCKDIWNASLLKDAIFLEYDIPLCPTTSKSLPKKIITYEEALNIHRKQTKSSHSKYSVDAYVTFSIDDYKFDKGINAIWENPSKTIKLLKHFKGIITPDFSTYIDFPDPIKRYNTFRMRAFGYFCGKIGLEVINNVRWDPSNDYEYCFIGIPNDSIIFIGTVASQLKIKENYSQFEEGFWVMIKMLNPKTILVYGSSKYPCFIKARDQGIEVIEYPSSTSEYYRRKKYE